METTFKCLICGSSAPDSYENWFGSSWCSVPQLSKNLQVYFLLKQVLGLPNDKFEDYLHSDQDLCDVIICENCTVTYVDKCVAIFKQLMEVQARFREARKQVVDAIKHQVASSDDDCSTTWQEIRDHINKYDYNWTTGTDFTSGDLKATEKLLKNESEPPSSPSSHSDFDPQDEFDDDNSSPPSPLSPQSPPKQSRSSFSEANAFSCSVCERQFSKKCYLVNHQRYHEKSKLLPTPEPTRCDTCSKIFKSHLHMLRHVRLRHQKPSQDAFKATCEYCNQPFIKISKFKDHMASVHSIEEYRRFTCDVPACGRGFWIKSYFENHTAWYHNPVTRPFKKTDRTLCPDCGKPVFVHGLEDHRITHQPPGERVFECSQCGQQFKSLKGLQTHRLLDHPPEEGRAQLAKTYTCEECGEAFARYKEWNLHNRKHVGLACEFCGKKFSNTNTLSRHQIDVHFICKLAKCKEQFANLEELWKHQQKCHPLVCYLWKCEICGKLDANQSHHKTHMKVHEIQKRRQDGEKVGTEFVCDSCGKAFAMMEYLQGHIRNTHKRKRVRKRRVK